MSPPGLKRPAKKFETLKRVGRWLLFLPGALVASVIAGGIVKLFVGTRICSALLIRIRGWVAF